MLTFLMVLIIAVSFLLILAVLLQNSKGGGLAANFSSAQIMGVRKTADVLERGTWILASTLVGLCIITTMFVSDGDKVEEKKSIIQDQIENTQLNTPVAPMPQPTEEPAN